MVLVLGGAGYVGSHTVRLLSELGRKYIVYDNLSTGHKGAIGASLLIKGDILDKQSLVNVMREYNVDSVMHFAASSLVSESVSNPELYYTNNVYGTLNVLSAMKEAGVKNIVFSSTAAVYGDCSAIPITEETLTLPINPYGRTKLAVEFMLRDFCNAYGIKNVVLRYFNAAGAHKSGEIGEDHFPETHLIPNMLRSLVGVGGGFTVFASKDFKGDGTCIRDYVHVSDLASAHILALDYLVGGGESKTYNLGSGVGYSVNEIIATAERITKIKVPYESKGHRVGDPYMLVASAEKIEKELGWERKYSSLENIISTAWQWHYNRRNGYEDR